MDYDVLHICQKQEDYKKYRVYVKDHCVQPETKFILDVMKEYFDTLHQTTVDWDAFDGFIFAKHGARLGSTATVTKNIIKKMATYTPSISYEEVIKSFIEMDYVAQIMQECQEVKDGTSDVEHVHDLATKAVKDLGKFVDVESMFIINDIEFVCDRILTSGYEWRSQFLNTSLGPIRDGDFVLMAARVEVGKTTLLASEISYILPQMPVDRPIIWVNNEERSEQVFFRVVQAMLNATTEEIMADPKSAMKSYNDATKGRKLLITDGKTNHEKSLTSLLIDINPGFIVFDQLDKVGGFNEREGGEHIRLGKLYQWARELAKQYGPCIAASQLSADADRAEWPLFIGLDALRGSKVDKPGEVDAIVTIGKPLSPKPGEEFQRSMNVPKNKLAGMGKYFKEEMRHGQAVVMIDPVRSRYVG